MAYSPFLLPIAVSKDFRMCSRRSQTMLWLHKDWPLEVCKVTTLFSIFLETKQISESYETKEHSAYQTWRLKWMTKSDSDKKEAFIDQPTPVHALWNLIRFQSKSNVVCSYERADFFLQIPGQTNIFRVLRIGERFHLVSVPRMVQ